MDSILPLFHVKYNIVSAYKSANTAAKINTIPQLDDRRVSWGNRPIHVFGWGVDGGKKLYSPPGMGLIAPHYPDGVACPYIYVNEKRRIKTRSL